jgi:hypothetical protein
MQKMHHIIEKENWKAPWIGAMNFVTTVKKHGKQPLMCEETERMVYLGRELVRRKDSKRMSGPVLPERVKVSAYLDPVVQDGDLQMELKVVSNSKTTCYRPGECFRMTWKGLWDVYEATDGGSCAPALG